MTVPLSTAAVLAVAGGAARRANGLSALTLADAVSAPAATCACAPRDNLAVHRLLQQAAPGSALVVDAGGRVDGAYFGELAAIDARQRGLVGLVVDGAIRDGRAVAALGFPVFHAGVEPASCVKRDVVSVGEPVRIGGADVAPGDQVVADSDGVIVVPATDWPAIEVAAAELEAREEEIRGRLRGGARLADLLEPP